MKKYYSELTPKERIQAIVENKIYPILKDDGYRFVKSGISLKKDIDNFTYEIWFSRNHRNFGDEVCAFEVYAMIYVKNYNKWHKKVYGTKPIHNLLVSRFDSNIPNWDYHGFDMGYDLAIDDNEAIVESVIKNIKNAVIPFFDKVTSYEAAIDTMIENEAYYSIPMLLDFCEIIENKEKSHMLLEWFEKELGSETSFLSDTLEDLELRKERLKKV